MTVKDLDPLFSDFSFGHDDGFFHVTYFCSGVCVPRPFVSADCVVTGISSHLTKGRSKKSYIRVDVLPPAEDF